MGMAEIINLRHARKARARTVADTTAAANRAKFGRTGAERAADEQARAAIERTLDGARREE